MKKKSPAWKRMSTGRYIDLLSFTEEDVDLFDINTALNYTYRFSGHHKDVEPLTVAQHSVLVSNLAKVLFPGEEDVYRACVVHDFAEAYYGDVTTPVKKMMGDTWKEFTAPIDEAVNKKFHIDEYDNEVWEKMKICDMLALDIERRVMWTSQLGKDKWPELPLNDVFNMQRKRAMFREVSRLHDIDLGELL